MFDKEAFIQECQDALKVYSPLQAINELVRRAISEPNQLAAAFSPAEGGIDIVHHAPELTILQLAWPPAIVLYPHDHRMAAVIGLYAGQEDNLFYRRSAQGLKRASGKSLLAGDSVILGPEVIHSVRNPRQTMTCALHVYTGAFFATPRSEWDPETLQERPYNIANMLKAFADANERAKQAGADMG